MVSPMHKGRLGRGLASLIGEPGPVHSRLPPEGEQRMISIDQIRAGKLNPRKDFPPEELAELAHSIQQKGLVQPILVRPERAPGTGYEIVAGERRWRASQKAGLHAIPAIVRELEDQEVLELAIIENVQRADLNPIEEATGYNELIERYGYTQEALAEVIGAVGDVIIEPESVTPGVEFDRGLRSRLARLLGEPPELATAAGHDAGILSSAGVPAAMLFVRNPTGVSHSPAEQVKAEDCTAGTDALARVLADLGGFQ